MDDLGPFAYFAYDAKTLEEIRMGQRISRLETKVFSTYDQSRLTTLEHKMAVLQKQLLGVDQTEQNNMEPQRTSEVKVKGYEYGYLIYPMMLAYFFEYIIRKTFKIVMSKI